MQRHICWWANREYGAQVDGMVLRKERLKYSREPCLVSLSTSFPNMMVWVCNFLHGNLETCLLNME